MTVPNLRRLAACLLACLLLAFASTAAVAHAVLLSSEPAENAVLDTAPDIFVLSFNEPVSLLTAALIEPDGTQKDVSDGARTGTDLGIALPPGLGEGTYVLSWRVVSADGHPIGGAAVFSIGMVTGAAQAPATADATVSILLWASKAVLYAALFFGVGMAVFHAIIAPLPAPVAKIATAFIIAGAVAAPVSLGLQGLDALGLGLAGIASARAWTTGLATSYGPTAIICLIALMLAGSSAYLGGRRFRTGLAVAAWISAALALALSGHASAAYPQWITRPAVFLHIGGIVFWAGALLPLFLILRQPGTAAAPPLARFSRAIPVPVAMILVSGIALAVIQLGPDTASWRSPYGLILALKLGVLAVLFGLALWNRFALTGPARAGEAVATRRLRASIGVEIFLFIIVMGLVAGWRFTPPPRALAQTPATPIAMHLHTERTMAEITLSPGRAGINSLSIFLSDFDFVAIAPLEVDVAISAPDHGIEPIRIPASLSEDGSWRVDDLLIPVAGTWQLTLDIRLSRFELESLTETITFP